MKKFMKSIQMMAALLLAVAATTACSNDDNATAEKAPVTADAPKAYTLTVAATMGGEATTRALSIDGTTLNATWAMGDAIRVMKRREMSGNVDFALLGTLTATTVSADGLTATFTGSLDEDKVTTAGGLAEGDKLLLGYPGTNLGPSTSSFVFNYTGQNGTLAKIATNYDYCMTSTSKSKMVTVSSVDGSEVTTSGTAAFANQQAIVRFNLYESDGSTPIFPTSLDITAVGLVQSVALPESGGIAPAPSETTLKLTPDGSTNVIYAALRGISNKTVKLRATDEFKSYNYEKAGVTFENGKYYAINVKMNPGSILSLSTLTADYTAQNGDKLSGTLPSGIHLSIADGARVMLNGVTISESAQAGITCLGDATIILDGTNTVSTTARKYSAIQAGGSGTTLTILGRGSLNATGGEYGSGIGTSYGSLNGACGNIVITNGTVTATGGSEAAGIGSAFYPCGDITITGGTVTATGGSQAAGIGSGYGYGYPDNTSCGSITISGGTVKATGGYKAAGIGSGYYGKFASITITDGITSVQAQRGQDAVAPIGQGNNDKGSGSVTVDGVPDWAGAATEHLNFTQSKTNHDNDTWTLTHK